MRNLVLLTFVFCSLAALSQTTQAAKAADDHLNMPGPNAQNLMLGRWSITVVYPPRPGQPTGELGKGTEIWRTGPGGRSLIEEYHERNSSGETEGLGISWWDDAAQGQRFVWCENGLPSGCYVSKNVAKWEGDRLIWKEEQQSGGTTTAQSEVFRNITPGSLVQELQEGKNLSELHTTAIINASKLPDDPRTQMERLQTAISARHQAMVEGDEKTVDAYTAAAYLQTDIFGHVQDKSAWMSEYFRPLATLMKKGAFRWNATRNGMCGSHNSTTWRWSQVNW